MRILFLSPWFPFPPSNGTRIRVNNLLRGLATEHDVTLLSFTREPVSEEGLAAARTVVTDLFLVPWKPYERSSWRARLGFFSPRPRSVVDTYSPQMEETIRQLVTDHSHDLIVASQLATAAYVGVFGNTPTLLEEVEMGIYFQQVTDSIQPFQRLRSRLMWAKQAAYTRHLLTQYCACTVVSEQERALLRHVAPDMEIVELLPNCVDAAALSRVAALSRAAAPLPSNTVIFTGAFTYDVNYEAMVWFVRDVWPLVKAAVPNARLMITGDHAGRTLPPAPDVILTGFIDNVHEAIARAAVSVVPILQGGGTRLKILEAMALGTPVISTVKGAEGLEVSDGRDLLLADTPEAFAEATILLLTSPDRRQELVKNACGLVQRKYDWETELPRLLALVDRLAQ